MKIISAIACLLLARVAQASDAKPSCVPVDFPSSAETAQFLGKDSLPPPNPDHQCGSKLILIAIRQAGGTPIPQGYGLLGSALLDTDVLPRVAYQSMFFAQAFRFKLAASEALGNDLSLLLTADSAAKPIEHESIIVRREAIIHAIADELNARFIYNAEGNYGRIYGPIKPHRAHETLSAAITQGLRLLGDLQSQGVEDLTLRDSIGMACAVLEYDSVRAFPITGILGPAQIYRDALSATVKTLSEYPSDHSADVLDKLGWEMQARGLATHDSFLLSDRKSLPNIIKVVKADLARIKGRKENAAKR